MAIVYCRSCKRKITRMDTTCPRCGAPTSKLMPVFLGIIFIALCAVFYTVISKSGKRESIDVVVTPSSKTVIDRSGSFVAGSEDTQ